MQGGVTGDQVDHGTDGRTQARETDDAGATDQQGAESRLLQSNGYAVPSGREVGGVKKLNRRLLEVFGSKAMLVAVVIIDVLILIFVLVAELSKAYADDADAVPYTVTISSGVLNIREKPSMDSLDLGDLRSGDVVTATDYQNGWLLVNVSVETAQGWVAAEYLTDRPDGSGEYVNASGGRVRVRSTPDGEPVRWLKKDAKATVTRWLTVDGTAWAYVGDGYVRGDCLEEATGHE